MSRTYKLFYSWQSDTLDKCRKTIQDALLIAKDDLQNNYGIRLEIDYSTLGKSGMPSIDQTILRKIDDCDLFLCDLTPVCNYSKVEGNGMNVTKQVPNPNVLIELGYAMSAVGVDYIIPIAHQGGWLPSQLPFDINHHSVYCFTQNKCELTSPILAVIDYIKKHGSHRHADEPFWLHMISVLFAKCRDRFFTKPFDPFQNIITTQSCNFFSMRMSAAFPGERGLVEYSNRRKIRIALSKLLETPLVFSKCIGYNTRTDPIWWFRSGDSMPIDKFKHLGNHRYLIGWHEMRIKRIIAYVDPARDYCNYVYIEVAADKPTRVNAKLYTSAKIEEQQKDLGQVCEEYAIFSPCCLFRKKISKREADDGHTKILGRIIELKGRSESRIRSLTPYNYIVTACQSAFNNDEFDIKSGDVLNGMLDDSITKEQLNDFMMSFHNPAF